MRDFIQVVNATYLGNFKIDLEFSDVLKGVADLRNELWGSVLLLNEEYIFTQINLDHGVLKLAEWGRFYT